MRSSHMPTPTTSLLSSSTSPSTSMAEASLLLLTSEQSHSQSMVEVSSFEKRLLLPYEIAMAPLETYGHCYLNR